VRQHGFHRASDERDNAVKAVQGLQDLGEYVSRGAEMCKNKSLSDSLLMDPKWSNYSLADAVLDHGGPSEGDSRWRWFCELPNPLYPGSLACLYHESSRMPGESITQRFYRVINELSQDPIRNGLPSKDTLVIHARVGDVVDNATDSVLNLLSKQCYYYPGEENRDEWNAYVKPIAHYEQLSEQHAGKPMALVSSIRPAENYTTFKSCNYLMAVKLFLEERGHAVQVRFGRRPDDDIIYMANSSTFAPSGGHFSQLVASLVQTHGGSLVVSNLTSYQSNEIMFKLNKKTSAEWGHADGKVTSPMMVEKVVSEHGVAVPSQEQTVAVGKLPAV